MRRRIDRDELKKMVTDGKLRLLLGTDAASEGLNLQKLSALINLDLPWNPSRLEQRKGRIQRIGQEKPLVDIFNMRYANTVEDRVHKKLSTRLEQINQLFGQIPDTLEDLWIDIALGNENKANETLVCAIQPHPFRLKYHQVVRASNWESCRTVLSKEAIASQLLKGW
jgi:superfamily II DNA/RNA helicase